MSPQGPLNVKVASIAFGYPGARDAIPLRDAATDLILDSQPEWIRDGRNVAAAYVRGARPTIRVVLEREGPPGDVGGAGTEETGRVGAVSKNGVGVLEREVPLRFDAAGHTEPLEFQLLAPLPSSVGKLTLEWAWYLTAASGSGPLNDSEHDVYLTWRDPVDSAVWLEPWRAPDATPRWAYLPIVAWTCAWAAGMNDTSSEKDICDSIIRNLPASRLKYAGEDAAYTVPDMLQKGAGYCGGWSRMFQAMAGAQGVLAERRAFHVDWRYLANREDMWCAIVIRKPGLNREVPHARESAFHDIDDPPVDGAPVRDVVERRYRFWGNPVVRLFSDGHSVSFLRHEGVYYVYDASFFDHAIALDWTELPRPDFKQAVSVSRLGNFRRAYLDEAVDYMLGSLWHRGELRRTLRRGQRGAELSMNGLTVRTAAIPDLQPDGESSIAFFWGP